MKNFFIFLYFLFTCITTLSAQTAFPYYREWGTYVGGANTQLMGYSNSSGIYADTYHNIYVTGISACNIPAYSLAYYNQFATPPTGNLANNSNTLYDYRATFSNAGQQLFGSYTNANNGNVNNNLQRENLVGIDQQNNKYFIKSVPGLVSNLATPGIWLTNYTSSTSPATITLSKYSETNNLIWTTYLPNNNVTLGNIYLKFDENNNTYIFGITNENIPNLSTPNVFQENFINYSSTTISSDNGYVVKLNESGQKIWGSYFPTGFAFAQIYNGGIYFLSSYSPSNPISLVTQGTFQPNTIANQIIMKFNSNTGQREWGTYYGPYTGGYFGTEIFDLEVNETGLYISGSWEDTNNTTYYGTAGSFQPEMHGAGDLFLSKFDLTGNRTWSTYFGGNGYETILGSENLTILGNRIIITGNQFGADNISTSGAFLTTPPNNSPNLSNVFAVEFDPNGNRLWCSYYGGPYASSPYVQEMNPFLMNDGSLILWGTTASPTGIATSNGQYSTMINPAAWESFGFIAKFSPKEAMSTSESDLTKDLVLFDNPNNGNFSLQGTVLTKKNCTMRLYDAAGRLIDTKKLTKQPKQNFAMQNKLQKGTYVIEVSEEKTSLKTFKMIVK